MIRGFTLIEVLVYMTLLSLLFVGTHTMSSAITSTAERIHAETQILSEGIFISILIKDAITGSTVTHAGDDSFVLSDGRAFRRVNDVLWYDYANTSQQLTYPPISLSAFTGTLVSSPTEPTYVEITFTLSDHGVHHSFTSLLYP
jgi:prepilin-type N-terminal cleavage/methylation domain-containing protein